VIMEDVDMGDVENRWRNELRRIFERQLKVIQWAKEELGDCSIVKNHIYTLDEKLLYQPPYGVPYAQQETLNEEIQDMEDRGVIEPSISPWSAPIVMVKKKDGSMRLCIDYRKLNDVTRTDPYPIPLIHETLDKLGKAKWFCALDLASVYWQMQMAPDSKEKTAFTVPGKGRYEFNRMPFGLKNAPATFQRTMEIVLRELDGKICFVYLDDIIIFGETKEEVLRNLEKILERLEEVGLKIKLSKCSFLKQEVKYLGHIVTGDGIRPNPDKLKAIKEYPVPKTVKEIRGFIGLVGYY